MPEKTRLRRWPLVAASSGFVSSSISVVGSAVSIVADMLSGPLLCVRSVLRDCASVGNCPILTGRGPRGEGGGPHPPDPLSRARERGSKFLWHGCRFHFRPAESEIGTRAVIFFS